MNVLTSNLLLIMLNYSEVGLEKEAQTPLLRKAQTPLLHRVLKALTLKHWQSRNSFYNVVKLFRVYSSSSADSSHSKFRN